MNIRMLKTLSILVSFCKWTYNNIMIYVINRKLIADNVRTLSN